MDPSPMPAAMAASPGWWVVSMLGTGDTGRWHRVPVAGFACDPDGTWRALVPDGGCLTVAPGDDLLEHESVMPPCECPQPSHEYDDDRFCTDCAGLIGKPL